MAYKLHVPMPQNTPVSPLLFRSDIQCSIQILIYPAGDKIILIIEHVCNLSLLECHRWMDPVIMLVSEIVYFMINEWSPYIHSVTLTPSHTDNNNRNYLCLYMYMPTSCTLYIAVQIQSKTRIKMSNMPHT